MHKRRKAMSRILVTYATNAGSTAEIAEAVAKELRGRGTDVEVKTLEAVTAPDAYDAIVVGGPMVFGWHRKARAFLTQHQALLSRVPVAYFMVALSLTDDAGDAYPGIPLYRDPALAKSPEDPNALSFKERFTSTNHYLEPALQCAPGASPVSVAFFNGRLDYDRLNLVQRWFVRLAFNTPEGDFRNWAFIHEWAEDLSANLVKGA
jgi:menaquinone-dependent protoporphyrinogen oxidase